MSTNHHESNDAELHAARLTAHALGQLEGPVRAEVEAELEVSPPAREAVESAGAVAGLLQEAARHEPPPTPSAALRNALEQRLGQPEATAPATAPARRAWESWRLRAVLAASLLLTGLVGYLAWLNSGGGRRDDLARNEPQQTEEALPQSDETTPGALASNERPRVVLSEPASGWAGRPDGNLEGTEVAKDSRGAQSAGEMPGMGAATPSAPPGAGMAPQAKNEPTVTEPAAGPFGAPHWISSRSAPAMPPAYEMTVSPSSPGRPLASGKAGEKKSVSSRAGGMGARGGPGFMPDPEDARSKLAALNDSPRKPAKPRARSGKDSGAAGGKQGVTSIPPEQTMAFGKPLGGDDAEFPRELEEAEGQAPGTEQYARIVENEFEAVGREPVSTLSVDVDTASYANVRRFLGEGRLPPPDAVRIEEMVNYFPYRYPKPEGNTPFSVSMEVAQCPWSEGHRLFRVGLKGREIDRQQRGPSNLVFLLDVSGSMAEENKLPLVKEAMKMLVAQLTEDDRVAIVTYASSAGVRLESVNGTRKDEIRRAIDSLSAEGSTNGSAGIQLAYEQARRHFVKKGTNRVLLASDGDLNVGVTRDEDLVRLIREEAKSGVLLTILGVGTGNLKDSKMEKLADRGNGKYFYVDGLREAQKVLVEQMSGSLVTIAKDVKVRIEFNPREVVAYRLIGYENRRLAAADFDNDRKDAGEIGAGHTVTALYELVPRTRNADEEERALKYQRVPEHHLTEAAGSGELLTLALRYKEPDGQASQLLEFSLKDAGKRFGQASADFQFAGAVASFGMILRNSAYRGNATLASVEEIAASSLTDDPGGHRAEFLDLVRKTERIATAR